MTAFSEKLNEIGACGEAVAWAEGLGDVQADQAWTLCDRGDWLLWWLGATTTADTSSIAFWCAERARQSALLAIGPEAGARLAACAPIIDRATARAAREAAWEGGARAAWEAAAAAAAWEAAEAAELKAVAAEVRRTFSVNGERL